MDDNTASILMGLIMLTFFGWIAWLMARK